MHWLTNQDQEMFYSRRQVSLAYLRLCASHLRLSCMSVCESGEKVQWIERDESLTQCILWKLFIWKVHSVWCRINSQLFLYCRIQEFEPLMTAEHQFFSFSFIFKPYDLSKGRPEALFPLFTFLFPLQKHLIWRETFSHDWNVMHLLPMDFLV